MNFVAEIFKSLAGSPEARQLAGRLITSTALDCAGPECKGKSPPGFICSQCKRPLCIDHALGRAKPPGLLCGICAWNLWSSGPPPAPIKKAKRKR